MRSSGFRFALVCLAVLATACSGGGSGGGGGVGAGAGGSGTGLGGADSLGGGGGDPGGGTGGDIFSGDGGSSTGTCEPTTCEAQGKTCGFIADGCGSVVDCGGCGDGQICGLTETNVCAGIDDVCVRVSQAVACADKQCGVEGDGCGGTYSCGENDGGCPDGQACGLEAPYQCATIPGGTATECAARIESCASVGATCGKIGNGCGGIIDCDAETGGCQAGYLCGNDPEHPQTCAPYDACQPISAEQACNGTCGEVGDGCGGTYVCELEGFGCTGLDSCGGGGVPFECGQEDDFSCEPIDDTTACAGKECGYVGDGCGTAIDCSGGAGCGTNAQCKNGQCEAITPGCSVTPKATACSGKECGVVSDGCGGTYSCGSNGGGCAGGEQCGVLSAYQCDVPPPDPDDPGCVGRSQQEACAGKECGVAYDGCGTDGDHTYNCGPNNGACPGGQFCGAQAAYQCDPLPTPPACVPNGKTCDSEGWACGTFVDNCGNTENCGTCASNSTCMGGIGSPTTCVSVAGNGGDDCPLCDAVPTTCNSNQITRLTGRVITPGRATDTAVGGVGPNEVGVPNAFVYILRTNDLADLPTITAGIPDDGTSCDRCADQELGPVLTGDVTDASGQFVLEGNIPVGQEFLLVTKIGKFRRAERKTLSAGAACTTTALPVTMAAGNPTRLPRNTSDGLGVNIPKIAVSTGRIDAMECVFEKMGIASSQFTRPQLGGRIHLYRADGAWPDSTALACNACGTSTSQTDQDCRTANCGGSANSARTNFLNALSDASLYGSLGTMNDYDMVVFDCEGGGWDQSGTQRGSGADGTGGGNVRQYANRGGRMFLSHLSFSWLYQNGTTAYSAGAPFATGLGQADRGWDTAYTASGNLDNSGTGVLSLVGTPARQASPRIQTFADWMVSEAVTSAPGYTFNITDPRSLNTSLAAEDEEFVYRSGGNNRTQQFSFNTPYGAPEDAACGRIAYSGFHVAATSGSNNPFQNSVFPSHCAGNLTAQEKVLLFMLFDLGTCVGEEPEAPECTPLECDASQCGDVPDGCGGTLDCAGCPSGQVCDDNLCRVECVKTTCEAEGIACSTIADGCGGVLECPCNDCVPDEAEDVCLAGLCGYQPDGCSDVIFCGDCPNSCVPEQDCPPGVCGTIGDGCNGTITCDPCPGGEYCGAAGPNECGPPACRPLECYELIDRFGIECGLVGDGCGETINCGTCPPGQICTVVDGQPNRCAGCVPKTQQQACAGLECGLVGDGCGGTLDCGTCPAGEYCGSNSPNMCDPGPQCQPQACPSGAQCGVIGDGCGGTVSCGTCPAGQLCGVYEPYKCGGCTPQTCESMNADCGKIGDGCGNELDCGECSGSSICGLGRPNQCGQLR